MNLKKPTHFPNIAFFDSGQGGLTVWEAISNSFPTLNTSYLGDNARIPYGNKSPETVTKFTSEAILFLTGLGAELIVVACGTASSLSVKRLREVFKLPVIGIVEGFCEEAALLKGNKGRIAVLGTRSTVGSGAFQKELQKLNVNDVWQKACPLFVPLVEEGIAKSSIATATAELYLADMPNDVNVVMLACTHFPRIAETIAKIVHEKSGRSIIYKTFDKEISLQLGKGEPIYFIDSASSIIKSVDLFLKSSNKNHLLQSQKQMYCTDAAEQFAQVAKIFTTHALPEISQVQLGAS